MGRSLLIMLGVWAAIYLPGLGSLEIKGEEGRRILPAIAMMESGDAARDARELFRSYLVPQVGGEAYLRKPPLVNWLVVASFKIIGARNEWSARVPSTVFVLAVAMAFVVVGRASLGAGGSTISALIWLTCFGMIEKGRLIEIEALYVSLFALAFICWLGWWEQKRSAWLTWIVPGIFLGLGWLAKGPQHLIFFYAIVFAILWKTGEWRKLFSFQHLIGILLMLSIFAAWAVPALMAAEGVDVARVWSRQFSGRLAGEGFKFRGWIMNIPRGIGYFLPWAVLLPLAWHGAGAPSRRWDGPEDGRSDQPARGRAGSMGWGARGGESDQSARGRAGSMGAGSMGDETRRLSILRGLGWGIAGSFLLVALIPGSLARYTMPLVAPAAVWLVMALSMQTKLSEKLLRRFVASVVIATCVCMLIYAFAIVPRLQSRQKVKPIAENIDSLLPAGETLYAVDPDYQPFLFYLRHRVLYVSHVYELPAEARYFFVEPRNADAAAETKQFEPRRTRVLSRIKDYRNRTIVLFAVE